ncbi:hypothetical protein [Labrenzia sp. 011]|uniref:hypothetical protein n=1 Tax=Labrenzia sp. 011 TaxID=2171494 RepID=UPI00197CAE4F|nr:hypothetical protein [Labrenzia sp. 011]
MGHEKHHLRLPGGGGRCCRTLSDGTVHHYFWISGHLAFGFVFGGPFTPASREAQTRELWVYDYRTNIHKTLKTKQLVRADLDDFVTCYKERKETERFKRFAYDELIARDKLNLDLFWLKDDSLEDIDSLPEPDVIAAEIVENLEAALEQFRSVSADLDREPSE